MVETALVGGVRLPIQRIQVDGHPTSIDYRVCTIKEIGEIIELCSELKERREKLLVSQIEDYKRMSKNYRKKYKKDKKGIEQKINEVLEKCPPTEMKGKEKEEFDKFLEMPFKYTKRKFKEKLKRLQYSYMIGEVGREFSEHFNLKIKEEKKKKK